MYIVAVDIEGTRKPLINPWQIGAYICSIGIKTSTGEERQWILEHKNEQVRPREEVLKEVQEYLDKADLLVAHNAKFDRNHLKWIGLDVGKTPWWCTMVGDYIIHKQKHPKGWSLNACLKRHNMPLKEDMMKVYWEEYGYETDEIPLDIHIPYLRRDVESTLNLYWAQAPTVRKMGLDKLMRLQCTMVTVLSDMEVHGVGFDKVKAMQFYKEAQEEVKQLEAEMQQYTNIPNFNAGSAIQKSAALFGGRVKVKFREKTYRKLKSGKIKEGERWAEEYREFVGLGFVPEGERGANGAYPVGKKILKRLRAKTKEQKAFRKLLLDHAKVNKVVTSLITKDKKSGLIMQIGSDGRIHPSFNMCVTKTGRLSSSNPNGQNLPRKGTNPIKKCFVPTKDDYVMVNLDLAQVEFRVAAELSRDPKMQYDLNHGVDTHAENASELFINGPFDPKNEEHDGFRTTAKIVTFRLLYGGSAVGFHKDGDMPDLGKRKWEQVVTQYKAKFKGLSAWQEENVKTVYRTGTLVSPTGRQFKYDFDGQKYEYSQICNYIVQSASSDVMYLVMATAIRKLWELGIDATLVLQVHDSMVFECHKDQVNKLCRTVVDLFDDIPNLMKSYFGWDYVTPMGGDAEVGPSYGEQTKYEDF